MELKLLCDCGQKYAFDVEPVDQQMPFTVTCPTCGVDGTNSANALLSEMPATAPPPTPVTTLRAVPPSVAPIPARTPSRSYSPSPAVPGYLKDNPRMLNNSFPLGILGAFIGAIAGVVLMFGFTVWAGFRFPLTGTVMGVIIGFGARLLYRGTSSSLGFVAAAIAFLTIAATQFLLFGLLGMIGSVLSVLVGTSFAFKIASD